MFLIRYFLKSTTAAIILMTSFANAKSWSLVCENFDDLPTVKVFLDLSSGKAAYAENDMRSVLSLISSEPILDANGNPHGLTKQTFSGSDAQGNTITFVISPETKKSFLSIADVMYLHASCHEPDVL